MNQPAKEMMSMANIRHKAHGRNVEKQANFGEMPITAPALHTGNNNCLSKRQETNK